MAINNGISVAKRGGSAKARHGASNESENQWHGGNGGGVAASAWKWQRWHGVMAKMALAYVAMWLMCNGGSSEKYSCVISVILAEESIWRNEMANVMAMKKCLVNTIMAQCNQWSGLVCLLPVDLKWRRENTAWNNINVAINMKRNMWQP